ncbi:hypothetical protein TEA_019873 [Camellia sinensis var. sinensis]|nr:hypothetical protein TEA_019873 [Camellia sinensis var. sinensis]
MSRLKRALTGLGGPNPCMRKNTGMKLKPTPNKLLDRSRTFSICRPPAAEGVQFPFGIDRFKQQFTNLEEHYGKGERSTPLRRQYTSLPRERVCAPKDESSDEDSEFEKRATDYIARTSFQSPTRSRRSNKPENAEKAVVAMQNGPKKQNYSGRDLF